MLQYLKSALSYIDNAVVFNEPVTQTMTLLPATEQKQLSLQLFSFKIQQWKQY